MASNKATIGNLFNYDLDFQGGSSTNVTFNEDMSLEEINEIIKEVRYGEK